MEELVSNFDFSSIELLLNNQIDNLLIIQDTLDVLLNRLNYIISGQVIFVSMFLLIFILTIIYIMIQKFIR